MLTPCTNRDKHHRFPVEIIGRGVQLMAADPPLTGGLAALEACRGIRLDPARWQGGPR